MGMYNYNYQVLKSSCSKVFFISVVYLCKGTVKYKKNRKLIFLEVEKNGLYIFEDVAMKKVDDAANSQEMVNSEDTTSSSLYHQLCGYL